MNNVLSKVGLDVHKEKVLLALITPPYYLTDTQAQLGFLLDQITLIMICDVFAARRVIDAIVY